MIIDAHNHLFTLDTNRYPLADPAAEYRPLTDASANELKREMIATGVERAFTITAGFYGWGNGYTMASLTGNEDWLAAGVLVDPTSPQGPGILEEHIINGASGLRIQKHLHYHRELDDPISTPLWAKAAELDLTVDINATHEEYAAVERRVRQFPRTRFILDHCGYVSGILRPGKNTVTPVVEMARYPNTYAKLTFLTLASSEGFPFRDVHWMVRDIVNAFGPERCLFGCNFPTQQYCPGVTYSQMVETFASAIELSSQEREWILGGTAQGLWCWVPSGDHSGFPSSAGSLVSCRAGAAPETGDGPDVTVTTFV